MTTNPNSTNQRERPWGGSFLAWAVELISGLSAVGFFLSCSVSYIVFGFFGINYFEIASPSDVIMNGLNYLLIIVGSISFWGVFTLLLMHMGPSRRAGRSIYAEPRALLIIIPLLPMYLGLFDVVGLLCTLFWIGLILRTYWRYPKSWEERVRCTLWPRHKRNKFIMITAKGIALIYFVLVAAGLLFLPAARFFPPGGTDGGEIGGSASASSSSGVDGFIERAMTRNVRRLTTKPLIAGICDGSRTGWIAWSGSNAVVVGCARGEYRIVYGSRELTGRVSFGR